MSFYAFRLLSPVTQLYWVINHGTFLANHWDDERGVNLYHCADEGRGFFVELGIDDSKGQAVVLLSFSSSGPLEDYAQGVSLPGKAPPAGGRGFLDFVWRLFLGLQ
jgi:hypothetical protein